MYKNRVLVINYRYLPNQGWNWMEQFYVQRHDFYVYLKCHVLVLFGTLDNFYLKFCCYSTEEKKTCFLCMHVLCLVLRNVFFLLYKFRINVMHSFVSMLWPVRTAIISSLFSGNLNSPPHLYPFEWHLYASINRESGDDCCVLVISILPLSTIFGLFRHCGVFFSPFYSFYTT